VDAIYLKIREGGKVISKALYVAIGVNARGRREVLGFMVSTKEAKAAYVEFFRSLKARGLQKFDLITSDDHDGLREAIKQEFLGASWQRCQTHFSKNMLDKTPKKMWAEVKALLRDIYTAPDIKEARRRKDAAVALLSGPAPKAAELLDESFDDIAAVFSLPLKYRQKMRTSNGIERVNEEIRRRDRAIRIYPSDGSVMRIIGSMLLDQTEAWQSGTVYFDMKEYLAFVSCKDESPLSRLSQTDEIAGNPTLREAAEESVEVRVA